ncbi:MAG: hypothetical protein PHS57_03230 [Alphaproteobacteria bacterium]|nr:hypothetical protein [Alphaproteobacteria bacterium]
MSQQNLIGVGYGDVVPGGLQRTGIDPSIIEALCKKRGVTLGGLLDSCPREGNPCGGTESVRPDTIQAKTSTLLSCEY